MTERKRTKHGAAYTNVNCPHKFCPGKIVYNGNYYCEMWDEGQCDFALQQDEYEQVWVRGHIKQVLANPAPPLHKRMWEEIKTDVWGSVEAYDKWVEERQSSGPSITKEK